MDISNLHKTVRLKREQRFPVSATAIADTRAVTEAKPVVQEFLLSLKVAPEGKAA